MEREGSDHAAASGGPGDTALTSPALPVTRVQDPADLPFVTDPGERRGDMLYRRFGRASLPSSSEI